MASGLPESSIASSRRLIRGCDEQRRCAHGLHLPSAENVPPIRDPIRCRPNRPGSPAQAREFYAAMLEALNSAQVPFLIGGAYALAPLDGHRASHQGPGHLPQARRSRPGPRRRSRPPATVPRQTFPHWLAKAFADDAEHAPFVDLIYRSGNGLAEVDDEWFAHAIGAEVLGVPVKLIPAEENLWSKAFVMERERFDGADVAHLIHAIGAGSRLGPAAPPVRPPLAGPHGPPGPVRLHLPVRPRPGSPTGSSSSCSTACVPRSASHRRRTRCARAPSSPASSTSWTSSAGDWRTVAWSPAVP